jgi:GNAT superfamily N-acetyltransferase
MIETFTVRRVQTHEFAALGDLIAQVFSRGDADLYQTLMHWWIFSLPRMPGFDYGWHRVGVLKTGDDERIVAHAVVYPFTMSYGGVLLRVSGVGAVCTHPDYRSRGYAAAVLHDGLAYMAEQGAHLALLNGISNYYERFGFSSVFPNYFFEVESEPCASLTSPLRLRPATVDDAPYLAALYERHWSWRVTFTRSAESWRWRLEADNWTTQIVEDASGRIYGYIAQRGPMSEHAEVVADTPEAAFALLSETGRLYRKKGLTHIRWILPPDDAVVAYARQIMPITLSASYRPSGGWMARLIDTEGLVSTLLPEISAQASSMGVDISSLILNVESDVVEIGLRDQPDTQCILNHQDFIQLVFGSLRPGALALMPHNLPFAAIRLLEALFPARMAVLACWDWF